MSKKEIGRNAPCPCGSGKKYKACCLKKESADATDFLWQRLRLADTKLNGQLLKFAGSLREEYALVDAWDEFVLFDDSKDLDYDSPENQAFIPWLLYDWHPLADITDEDSENDLDELPTIAEVYLEQHWRRISEMEREFIELNLNANFSFYEVIECRPGTGFLLSDIFTGREVFVIERSGSEQVLKGCILFARMIQYKEIALLMGCGSCYITPGFKTVIIDLRSEMREFEDVITQEILFDWEEEIRSLYMDIYDRVNSPLTLTNTDGHELCFHDLNFKVSSGRLAFERLHALAFDVPAAELFEEAELHDNGEIKLLEFSWIVQGKPRSGMENIVFAQIKIEENMLTVSVNSKERAKKARTEIEKRMKGAATFVEMKVVPYEEAKALMADKEETSDQIDLNRTPEVQALLKEPMDSHWQTWPDIELPALAGMTPREAVCDADGREKVAALLNDIEIREQQRESSNQLFFIERTRKELGLI